jgi:predicted ATPase
MSQHQVDDALAQLVRAELIFQRGTPPDAEYTFKHALVQDAAYSTLLRSRRQQIHLRIAATLEDKLAEITHAQPALLAHHCIEAGLAEKAVGYSLKAGRQALARSTMREAEAHVRRGLALVSEMPDSEATREQELDLLVALGSALAVTKGYATPERGEVLARARQLCERFDRPWQLGSVLQGQCQFRIVRGELMQARHHAEEVRLLGEVHNDGMWKCVGSSANGTVCLHLGKFIAARAYLENALSLWEPTYDSSPIKSGTVIERSILSRILHYLGYIDQAQFQRQEALLEARRLAPDTLAFALFFAFCGDWAIEGTLSAQTSLRSADELSATSTEHGFSQWLGLGKIMRGWCFGVSGHEGEGISLLVQGIADVAATGLRIEMPFYLMLLAEIYGIAARPQEGLDRLAEAAEFVETTEERCFEPELRRLRGTLLRLTHEHAAAESSYQHALALARQQRAKLWELRAATSLARLWRDQGKRIEARDLLAPIYEWFTEGFDTPVLQDAKALLDELT